MTTQEVKEIKERGFTVIPIKKLNCRYCINKDCKIIDTTKDTDNCVIYSWHYSTAMNPIKIYLEDGESVDIPPARLLVITYYGFLEADIYDMGYGVPSARYKYVIDVKENLDDNTLVINTDIFKYSKKYKAYANQFGCIYKGYDILKHHIQEKEYHMITASYSVHRVVYDAWTGLDDITNNVYHIDGNNWNNYYKNLQEIDPGELRTLESVNYIYSDEIVYKVCKLMSEGMRPAEAARIVGIPSDIAVKYRRGARSNISSQFTYPKLEDYRYSNLTADQVKEICELFGSTSMTNKEIGERYNVNQYLIKDIRKRRTWRDISKDYEFEPVNPGSRQLAPQVGNVRNASITEDDVIKIYKLLLEGHRICDVRDMTGISYSIIKKIKYKTRWASVTDKLDAELANQHNEGSTTIERVS